MVYAIIRYKMFEGPIEIISLYDNYQECKAHRKIIVNSMPESEYAYELRGINSAKNPKVGDIIGEV